MADDLNELGIDELRDRAKTADIKGRSNMNKEELIEALSASSQGGISASRQSPDPLQGLRGATRGVDRLTATIPPADDAPADQTSGGGTITGAAATEPITSVTP